MTGVAWNRAYDYAIWRQESSTAVGRVRRQAEDSSVPAYRNRAGHGPGTPAELAHFDQLMSRLESRLRGGLSRPIWGCSRPSPDSGLSGRPLR
jgi:hypothetical protein